MSPVGGDWYLDGDYLAVAALYLTFAAAPYLFELIDFATRDTACSIGSEGI